ncbi:MAG: Yip1 family protein [Burkholderiales bacterium]
MIARTKQILLTPDEAWREIEGERLSPVALLLNYALPLAAIGPAALALRAHFFDLPTPPLRGLALVAAGTALNLAAAACIAIAAMFVSAVLGGKRDLRNALALSFYSATPLWLSSVSILFPEQAVFAIVVFGALMYGLYLFYLGLHALLKVPQDDAGIATAIVITLAMVAFGGLGWGFAWVV